MLENACDVVARVGAMAVKPCSRQSAVDYRQNIVFKVPLAG